MVTVHARYTTPSEIYSTGNRYSTGIQWEIKLVAFKNNALPTTLREVIYACSGTHIFSLTNGMYTFTYNFTALRPILFPNAFVMPLPIRDLVTSALNSALTTSATRVLRVFFPRHQVNRNLRKSCKKQLLCTKTVSGAVNLHELLCYTTVAYPQQFYFIS